MTVEHNVITTANMHGIVAFEPANAAARTAITPAIGNLYKTACQQDDGSLWIVLPAGGGSFAWKKVCDGPAGSSPLTIITSVPVRTWLRADLGVTIATGVSAWIDQSTNAQSFAQATGSLQPTRNLTDSTLNNLPTITGDGTDDLLVTSALSAVGATYWMCLILKQVSWVASGRRIIESAGGSGRNSIQLNSTTPSILLYENGNFTPVNNGAPVGSWKRVTAQENNTTSDAILAGASSTGTTALGRSAATNGLTLFNASGGGQASNVAIAEVIITDGIPSGTEKTNIDAYLLARYSLSSLFT